MHPPAGYPGRDEGVVPDVFPACLHNIIANISLKALQNDSINAAIKRLSVDEQSGFELRKLSLKVIANNKDMKIENFAIEMPGTEMKMDTIRMEYDSLKALNHFCR